MAVFFKCQQHWPPRNSPKPIFQVLLLLLQNASATSLYHFSPQKFFLPLADIQPGLLSPFCVICEGGGTKKTFLPLKTTFFPKMTRARRNLAFPNNILPPPIPSHKLCCNFSWWQKKKQSGKVAVLFLQPPHAKKPSYSGDPTPAIFCPPPSNFPLIGLKKRIILRTGWCFQRMLNHQRHCTVALENNAAICQSVTPLP